MVQNGFSVGGKYEPKDGSSIPVTSMVESIVGCKWSVRLLQLCTDGINRPNAFRRACPGLSAKVMNEQWQKMIRFGIVQHTVYGDKPPPCGFIDKLRKSVIFLIVSTNNSVAILICSETKSGMFPKKGIMKHLEIAMKSFIAIIIAALLFLISCANTQNTTAGEREAIRRSNAKYEYMRGP